MALIHEAPPCYWGSPARDSGAPDERRHSRRNGYMPIRKRPQLSRWIAAAALAWTCVALAAESDLSVNARLLLAARNSDTAGIERALSAGASPDARNRLGETALVIALKKKDVANARRMLDAGTDVNQAAVNGITPLMAAAFAGDREIVEKLLAKGADPAPLDRLGKNAITYAAGEGHAAIVKALLAKGVDANGVYKNDLTALMWAAGYGRIDAARALLEAGARTDLKDNRGKTATDIARDGGFSETAALLEGWKK